MFEVVGSPFCVAFDDGQKVHKHLDAALRANQEVVLSFHNVTALTTVFLTAAVGELYETFSEEEIRSLPESGRYSGTRRPCLAVRSRHSTMSSRILQRSARDINQIFQEVLEDDEL